MKNTKTKSDHSEHWITVLESDLPTDCGYDDGPGDGHPTRYYRLEYQGSNRGFPEGVAYVTRDGFGPIMWYVQVADDCRRQGIGRELLLACRQLWPDIHISAAISKNGQRLTDSIDRVRRPATVCELRYYDGKTYIKGTDAVVQHVARSRAARSKVTIRVPCRRITIRVPSGEPRDVSTIN